MWSKNSNEKTLVAELYPSRGLSVDEGPHTFLDHLTVEAWVHGDEERAEILQAVASKWQPKDPLEGFAAFDAGHTSGLTSMGYFGAVFDGRYVYFVPELQPQGAHAIALRYDTHGDFKSPGSYEAFDASCTDGLDTRGYYGAVFDGRYVFYVPRSENNQGHCRLLRYDTHGGFVDRPSWNAFDYGVEQSHQNAAFDGHYLYLCPGYRPREHNGNRSGRIIRYNTWAPFKDRPSYEVFDAENIGGLEVGNFDGAAFDGRHIYFVPLANSVCLRYDTQANFTSRSSWEAFDASPLGMGMCVGAVFDGRYLYYVPYENGIVVRCDTLSDFRVPASWLSYNAGRTDGLDTRGYDGGFFDGRYIHFVPFVNNNETFHANWLRYDPQKPLDDPHAWVSRNVANTDGLKTKGYNGGAFDGRFFYAAPWRSEWGERSSREGWDIHGRILRYDSLGNDGTFSLRYCDYGHNGGLCAAVPGASFLVNTTKGVLSVAAHRALPPGWHHLAGVFDGKSLRLYVDGELAAQRPVSGTIQCSDAPIVAGRINRGLGQFRGIIEQVAVFSVARSEEEIRLAYHRLKARST